MSSANQSSRVDNDIFGGVRDFEGSPKSHFATQKELNIFYLFYFIIFFFISISVARVVLS